MCKKETEKTTQLHAPFESRLYLTLKAAVKELGYGTLAGWCRAMAMSTIREWEEMKRKARTDEK